MVKRDFQLKGYNTFGLPSSAKYFFSFREEQELAELISSGKVRDSRILVLGGGSNILFTADFEGIVIHPDIRGHTVEENNSESVVVSAGAGVIWDDFVSWCVANGYYGIENLSLIPGTVGASPVQNIGAYGSEAGDTIERVRFMSLDDGKVSEISGSECRFGYRDSIFKHDLKGKVVVTKVWFRLSLTEKINMSYGDVAAEMDTLGGVSLMNLRQSVINIRRRKLPDPLVTGNAGSFFKNPFVTAEHLARLLERHPGMPCYRLPDGNAKVAAGWLIDQCGWKGYRRGDAGVHPQQALVIVNYGYATGVEIVALANEIRLSVRETFGLDLTPEVEII